MINKAMILAAGEGRRMQPLTLKTPKPLLKVAGKSLLEWHLLKLRRAGIREFVINIAYLGEQIMASIGDGARFDAHVEYSVEPEPLETGGAINAALQLLGETPVLLINGDIWIDHPITPLLQAPAPLGGHLVLIPNPPHNPRGDYSLAQGVVTPPTDSAFTFSGLSILRPDVFASYPECRERFALREYFDWLIAQQCLTGERFDGYWLDVGTPQRLQALDSHLSAHPPTRHL